MELYILSNKNLKILSIAKLTDYQINLDEETNAKSTFSLMKTNGLKKENYMVLNGLYRQFIFVIDDVQTEKDSDVVTVTALDISNIFDRKVIEKNIDIMKSKSIEEFLANTISENFVNSDDTALNVGYIDIGWKTNTKTTVATNAENGLYNFHTFLINCRQYKNIYTDFKLENLGNPQTVEGKRINIEAKNRKIVDISFHGESTQKTRSGKNLAILGVTSGTIGEVPFIVDKGTININGTTISGDANYYFNSFRVSNSGVATFWIEITGYTDKLSNQAGILLQESSDNSTWSTTKEISCKSTATKQYQVTLDNSKYYRIRFYTKENTFTNATIKIQLEYGTNKTEFEEAGVSPSPDYRSPIENVEGKNKFDVKDTVKQYGEFELLNDNDKLVLVATGTLGAQYAKNIISGLNKNKTYRFSCKAKKISKVTEGSYININISGSNDGTTFTSITNLSSSGTSEGIEYSLQANLTNYEYYRFYFYNHPSTPVVIGEQTEYYDIQLKENTEPTDYVPYNSLEFKVEGKNRFDKSKDFSSSNISKNLWTITQLENGLRVMSNYSSGTPYIRYIITDLSNFIGKTIRAKANFVSSSANKGAYRLSICNADGTNPTVKKFTDESNKEISFIVETLEEGKNFLSFELYSNFTGGTQSPTAYVDYTDIIITIDDENMTYEPYKSQVATFPLGNQKLMEGSYLDDEGIHRARKQVVFDGSEIWSKDENKDNSTDYFYIKNIGINTNNINSVICDYFKKGSSNVQGFWATTVFCITINKTATGIVSSDTKDQRVAKWKTWLSEHPITVEYELSEEETVPYTAEQQTAWNNIKNLTLFEGVNHISSDANMVLKYYPLEPVGLKFVLRIDIEKKQETTKLIDTTLPEVTDYNKIYEEDVTAKVQVYIREDGSEYNLYLKTDRTTTTNKDDPDRASGKIEVISVETADRAEEEALNVMKGNNYKHLVEFKIAKTSKLMDITQLHIGRPIRIKTDDDIYDSYISAITLSDEKFVYFKSGSLRITLLDKLKKTSNTVGDKLDRTGGKITGNLDVSGTLKENGKKVITDLDNINTEITSVAVPALAVKTDTTEHVLKSFTIETAGRYMFLADVPLNYYRSNR